MAEFVISLPQQDVQSILTLAAAGKLIAISLAFPPFKWNKTLLHSIGVEIHVDKDNW